jgi:glycosyltransferase involved in cell wall biosynthesis
MERHCWQINLQPALGGGEIYTRFFTRALAAMGVPCTLFTTRGAAFWRDLELPAALVEVDSEQELMARLPRARTLIVTHTVASETLAQRLAAAHTLTGFAHMPLYEREPRGLRFYHRVFGVSQHVIDSARARGLANVHAEPMYGAADLSPRGQAARLSARSPYEWDRRKARDRLLSLLERGWPRAFAAGGPFRRVPGALTLGIVSRLTPIKQFPQMFAILAPAIARFHDVRLELFGAGGYASVRDLRRALAPCRDQVRFWGHQPDVKSVYAQMDYVLSGLPEKEALGLNLLEAQAGGTPVLAVRKPPFTETVSEGRTGFLFDDPREDHGRSFAALLERIRQPGTRPSPSGHAEHLARFSEPAFGERVQRALADLW